MEKWADYLIVEVVYDATHTQIVEATCRRDTGDEAELCAPLSRDAIIQLIGEGITFAIAVEDSASGTLERGRPVHVMHLSGQPYLKARRDLWRADNLLANATQTVNSMQRMQLREPTSAHSGKPA